MFPLFPKLQCDLCACNLKVSIFLFECPNKKKLGVFFFLLKTEKKLQNYGIITADQCS